MLDMTLTEPILLVEELELPLQDQEDVQDRDITDQDQDLAEDHGADPHTNHTSNCKCVLNHMST